MIHSVNLARAVNDESHLIDESHMKVFRLGTAGKPVKDSNDIETCMFESCIARPIATILNMSDFAETIVWCFVNLASRGSMTSKIHWKVIKPAARHLQHFVELLPPVKYKSFSWPPAMMQL